MPCGPPSCNATRNRSCAVAISPVSTSLTSNSIRVDACSGEIPAVELPSERLPWPGEETVEDANGAEGPALDETLWTGRPRDFDWGD